ncbi:hypothetical protein V499_00037 [Pseudogymnoascus sp. VKM F-103]|nr:hypothetical protein V499_00037 [Pseudogymnoascus sp. VKM F-103]
MANLFTLVGPCSTYDLDSMLAEAIKMATNAQTQIGAVTSGAIAPLTTKARIANNAQNMFSTDTKWNLVLDSTSKGSLSTVSGVYGNLLSAIQNGANLGPATNFFICTDETLEYVNDPSMLGPVPANSNDEITLYGGAVWTDKTLRDANDVVKFVIYPPAGTTPICSQDGGRTAAQTFIPTNLAINKPSNIMIFCPGVWDTTKVKTSLVPYQGDYFKSGDKASPDDYRSLPGVFIHEMLHLLYPQVFSDKPMRDRSGTSVIAYNFDLCFDLARLDLDDALKNPDNYRLFAEGCFLPNVRWMAAAPTS